MRLAVEVGRLLLAIATGFVAIPPVAAADTMRFLTNIAPPYQEMVDGALDGTSLRALACVMTRLNQRYEVDLAPWLRAREQVRKGAVQGLFSVAPDFVDTSNGRLSLPLALERWVWVTMTGARSTRFEIGPDRRVAAVLGSNQLKWLERQGHDVNGVARSAVQLLRMLAAGRVDAVLVDEAELGSAWQEAMVDPSALTVSFQRYAPLGVYFANSFLDANPGFLERFNEEIIHCAVGNMALSAMERSHALAKARETYDRLLSDPALLPALILSNQMSAGKSVPRILAEDKAYQEHRDDPTYPSVALVRGHPLSAILGRLRADSEGTIAEVLIFDNAGITVAADPLSTDLWQADEVKFSKTVTLGPDAVFIDGITFDQSTNQFSVQVSFAIPSWEPGSVAGGMTVGLNIERTLNSPP
jgi:hypothetical protein